MYIYIYPVFMTHPISVGFGTLCHKSLLIMSLNIYTIYTHTHTHIYIYIYYYYYYYYEMIGIKILHIF